jgi:hypothetical protein
MMKLINLPLEKWATNSEKLKAIWRAGGQSVEAQTHVLGVNWNTDSDCLYIEAVEITKSFKEEPMAKRKLYKNSKLPRSPWIVFSGIPHREGTFPGHLVPRHQLGRDLAHRPWKTMAHLDISSDFIAANGCPSMAGYFGRRKLLNLRIL